SWFDAYHWLEYSTAKDAAYCLHCYLFKQEGNNDQSKKDYRTRLEASIECITWLIRNGCPLRGHDESMESNNRGLFLELLKFYSRGREHIESVVMQNAPKNLQMTYPDIQKDIVHALAAETTKLVVKDIGDNVFYILVDKARDVSIKEQMAMVLRYVDKTGSVVERFLNEIESMLLKHGLSFKKIRGQGYDGASNMKGEINGLKTLILLKTSSAYYIHLFFDVVSVLTNLVGASCKRRDIVRETQAEKDQDIVNAMHLVNVAKQRL
ncbi:Zinc finger MYM-type protein 1, partial [Linum perenne]